MSTGYSPYELMLGQTMRTPLDELVEMWSGKNEDEEKMSLVRELANQKEIGEKGKHKQYHDKKETERRFGVGDYALVFQPRKLDKLHNEWQGPVTVTKKITDMDRKGIACSMVWRSGTPWQQLYFLLLMTTPMKKLVKIKEDCHISTVSDHQEKELLELRKEFSDVIRVMILSLTMWPLFVYPRPTPSHITWVSSYGDKKNCWT